MPRISNWEPTPKEELPQNKEKSLASDFRLEHVVSSFFAKEKVSLTQDEINAHNNGDYDPWLENVPKGITDDDTQAILYEASAVSSRSANAYIRNWERERADRENASIGGSLVAGVLSTEGFLIPGAKGIQTVGKTTRQIRRAQLTAGAVNGTVATAISEGLLTATQNEREGQLITIGAGAVGGMLLQRALGGGAISKQDAAAIEDSFKVRDAENAPGEEFSKKGIHFDPKTVIPDADEIVIEQMAKSQENLLKRIDAGDISAEDATLIMARTVRTARQANNRLRLEALPKSDPRRVALKLSSWMAPNMRLYTSKSPKVRALANIITPNALRLEGDGSRAVSLMSLVRQQTNESQAFWMNSVSKSFNEHKKAGGTMKPKEFNEQVHKYMSGSTDVDPAVAAVGETLRAHQGKFEKRLFASGVINREFANVETLDSTDFQHLFNAEEWDEMTAKWLDETDTEGVFQFNRDFIKGEQPTFMRRLVDEGMVTERGAVRGGDTEYAHRMWDAEAIGSAPNAAIDKFVAVWSRNIDSDLAKSFDDKAIAKIYKALRASEVDVKDARLWAKAAVNRQLDQIADIPKKIRADLDKIAKTDFEAQRIAYVADPKNIASYEVGLRNAAQEAVNNITGGKLSRGLFRPKSVKSGVLKGRTLDVKTEDFTEFLVTDQTQVREDYLQQIMPELLAAESGLSTGFRKEIRESTAEFDDLIRNAKTEKQAAILQRQKTKTIKDLDAVAKLFYNKRVFEKPAVWTNDAVDMLKSLTVLTRMGGVLLSSVPDAGSLIMNVGVKAFSKEMAQLAKGSKSAFKSMKDAHRIHRAIEVTLADRGLRSMGEMYGFKGKTEAMRKKAVAQFMKVGGLSQWNAVMKSIGTAALTDELMEIAVKGASTKVMRKFQRAGLSADDMQIMKTQFEKHGEIHEGGYYPNFDKWDGEHLALVQDSKAAILDIVENGVVTPRSTDLPLASATDLGSLLLQFKAFALSANQRVFLAGLDNVDDMNRAVGLSVMLGLGYTAYAAKATVKGQEIRTDANSILQESIDRSGFFAVGMDANNIISKFSNGKIDGLEKLAEFATGEESPAVRSRYSFMNPENTLLGAWVGTAGDVSKVIQHAASGEGKEAGEDLLNATNLWQYQFLTSMLSDD